MPLDNRLAFDDQARFLALRATGLAPVAQWVWVYQRPVDLDGLRRFQRNLGRGLLGRRIERSPLPFARHRWISPGGSSDSDVARHSRPRAELVDWADGRAQLLVDPEWGPGWHLGVQSFSDGSTGVSLVASHCLVDGVGGGLAIADAIKGGVGDLGYPPPRSGTRLAAALSDARQTLQGLPESARALVAATKLARRRTRHKAPSGSSRPLVIDAGKGDAVAMPAIVVFVDLDDWDSRAKALGGTSNSLFTAFAAKLAERVGCPRADDGRIQVGITVNDRFEGDMRANAFSLATVDVDPTGLTTDLSGLRTSIKHALAAVPGAVAESAQLQPLIPMTPEWLARRMTGALLATPAVGCSYLGDVDPMIGRPDGSDADSFFVRGVTQHVTRQIVEQVRGMTAVSGGRIGDKVSIAVIVYDLNSKSDLRELAAEALTEFGLSGAIV
ncbi:hypothetical protein I546_4285 [Mycobacterium kansasii 732]|nr:hypothetical protein I546_4285 [Mycobacterium kansasii 732]